MIVAHLVMSIILLIMAMIVRGTFARWVATERGGAALAATIGVRTPALGERAAGPCWALPMADVLAIATLSPLPSNSCRMARVDGAGVNAGLIRCVISGIRAANVVDPLVAGGMPCVIEPCWEKRLPSIVNVAVSSLGTANASPSALLSLMISSIWAIQPRVQVVTAFYDGTTASPPISFLSGVRHVPDALTIDVMVGVVMVVVMVTQKSRR